MLEAIFLMFLLALTAVFWSYPPLRNSEHRLCGVLRTAPSGCLLSAAVLVAVLLPPVRLPLAFGVGAALMAAAIWLPLLNFIRDKLKITSGRNSGWGYALGYLVLALLFAAVVLGGMLYSVHTFDPARQPWRRLDLPGTSGLSFEYQPIHPFLAEYNYRVVPSGTSAVIPLMTNTGGRISLDVWTIPGSGDTPENWIFNGRYGEVLVDPAAGTAYRLTGTNGRITGTPQVWEGNLIQNVWALPDSGIDFTERCLRRRFAGRIENGAWQSGPGVKPQFESVVPLRTETP